MTVSSCSCTCTCSQESSLLPSYNPYSKYTQHTTIENESLSKNSVIQIIVAYCVMSCLLLREWLNSLELLDYLPYFKTNRVTAAQAKKELSPQLLRRMGITNSHDQQLLLEGLDSISELEEKISFSSSTNRVPFHQPHNHHNRSKSDGHSAIAVNTIEHKQSKKKEEKKKPSKKRKALNMIESRLRSGSGNEEANNDRVEDHKTAEESRPQSTGRNSRSVTISADSKPEPVHVKKPWEIKADEIALGDTIGEGGSGYVVKGEWRGIPVAVKKLRDQAMRKDQVDMFTAEIDMMSELRHPHIIQFLGASLESGNTFFITQLAERGNLHDVIVKENPSWRRRLQFARDIARGMNYLHQNTPPILHRDLKSMNVLIDENYKALLCDFGISRQIQNTGTNLAKRGLVSGTYLWTAPDEKLTPKSDVYSYGLVMWEILTGLFPFERYNLAQLIINVHTKGERPSIPVECDATYAKLMQRCWDSDPDIRPTFSEILKILDYLLESCGTPDTPRESTFVSPSSNNPSPINTTLSTNDSCTPVSNPSTISTSTSTPESLSSSPATSLPPIVAPLPLPPTTENRPWPRTGGPIFPRAQLTTLRSPSSPTDAASC